jgi:rhomboid protease GluP
MRSPRQAFTLARTPWATFGIMAVLLLAFIAEQIYAIDPPGALLRPGLRTLVALGALNRGLIVVSGEWYRVLTALLLHADLTHIGFNCLALYLAGSMLERFVGHAWFIATFLIGGVGGSLMSLAINPGSLISVGASGAIMALFAVTLTCSFHLPPDTNERQRLQRLSAQVLICSLLPLATRLGDQIDYGAHLGGAISGALIGLLLLRTWSDSARLPGHRRIAAGIAGVGTLLVLASVVAVARTYRTYAVGSMMIPTSLIPKTGQDAERRSADLVQRFPQDPRAHMYYGLTLAARHDYTTAEQELRVGLAQSQQLEWYFGRRLDNTLRAVLAATLSNAGRQPEAKEMARLPCAAPPDDLPNEQVRQSLIAQHLCD